jgi:hypothetical protein
MSKNKHIMAKAKAPAIPDTHTLGRLMEEYLEMLHDAERGVRRLLALNPQKERKSSGTRRQNLLPTLLWSKPGRKVSRRKSSTSSTSFLETDNPLRLSTSLGQRPTAMDVAVNLALILRLSPASHILS